MKGGGGGAGEGSFNLTSGLFSFWGMKTAASPKEGPEYTKICVVNLLRVPRTGRGPAVSFSQSSQPEQKECFACQQAMLHVSGRSVCDVLHSHSQGQLVLRLQEENRRLQRDKEILSSQVCSLSRFIAVEKRNRSDKPAAKDNPTGFPHRGLDVTDGWNDYDSRLREHSAWSQEILTSQPRQSKPGAFLLTPSYRTPLTLRMRRLPAGTSMRVPSPCFVRWILSNGMPAVDDSNGALRETVEVVWGTSRIISYRPHPESLSRQSRWGRLRLISYHDEQSQNQNCAEQTRDMDKHSVNIAFPFIFPDLLAYRMFCDFTCRLGWRPRVKLFCNTHTERAPDEQDFETKGPSEILDTRRGLSDGPFSDSRCSVDLSSVKSLFVTGNGGGLGGCVQVCHWSISIPSYITPMSFPLPPNVIFLFVYFQHDKNFPCACDM